MAWSDEARRAAAEARKRKSKGRRPKMVNIGGGYSAPAGSGFKLARRRHKVRFPNQVRERDEE